jgi:hypothetical protein
MNDTDSTPIQQPVYMPNDGKRGMPLGLLFADVALRRYMAAEYREADRIGYPRMACFAKEMALGTVRLPPPIEDDPLHDAVGAFYAGLKQIERRILAEFYLPIKSTLKQKAKRVSKSVRNFLKSVERLVADCLRWLQVRGFK